jgi:hypothetical protein
LDKNFLVENNLNDQLVMMMVMKMLLVVEYKMNYPKRTYQNFWIHFYQGFTNVI